MPAPLLSRVREPFRPDERLVCTRLGVEATTSLDDALEGPARAALERALERLERETRPWTASREIEITAISGDSVTLDEGTTLHGRSLAAMAREVNARRLVVVAASAGAPIERVVRELFDADRLDEAVMLDAAASALVEQLRAETLEHLARTLATDETSCGDALAPARYHAPGYEGWPLAETHVLLAALSGGEILPGRLEILESAGLSPAKSTLGVALVASAPGSRPESLAASSPVTSPVPAPAYPLRTLERWSRERLDWPEAHARRSRATFRFDGTTCASLGRPIALVYHVDLERDTNSDARLRIVAARVERAPHDTGLDSTCAALAAPDRAHALLEERPGLDGRHLDELHDWRAGVSPSGCLCRASDRDHKWRLVLHTLLHAASRLVAGPTEPATR